MERSESVAPTRNRDFLSELPAAPDFHPVRQAIAHAAQTGDETSSAALRLFRTMPESTGIIANPVRYRVGVRCMDTDLQLMVRAFGVRGLLREEDIVTGAAGPNRLIFVGLFGRLPTSRNEEHRFSSLLFGTFVNAVRIEWIEDLARLMGRFPEASPEAAVQYCASLQKAGESANRTASRGVRGGRPPSDLLKELLSVHFTHAVTGASAAYMRRLLTANPGIGAEKLASDTRSFVEAMVRDAAEPWEVCFALLLGRPVDAVEAGILNRLGTIQIHHGSAGSSMVARYMASLETAWTSDLFVAAHMAMDGRRHFGAIHDMTEFVGSVQDSPGPELERKIVERLLGGNLPTFGHPEISAAARTAEIEFDPRPALYLELLFDALDAGKIRLNSLQLKRLNVAVRMYDQAFVSGVRKPGSEGRPPLRIAPNTDFGAWCVQEALGVAEPDRTSLSYLFRGFGWMMDVREQLQQPLIRPVIPPDPRIVPDPLPDSPIPTIVAKIHRRLSGERPFGSPAASR